VDEHDDLVRFEAERVGGVVVVHVRDALDLEEVVTRTERPHLARAAVLGLLRHRREVGVRPHPLVLAVQAVLASGVPLLDAPVDAAFQCRFEVAVGAVVDAAPPRPQGTASNSASTSSSSRPCTSS